MKKTPLARRLATLAAVALLGVAMATLRGQAVAQDPTQTSSGSTATRAEPPDTNRPEKIFQDFFKRAISSLQAEDKLATLIKDSTNLPERIEAADCFARVCGMAPNRDHPVRRGSTPEEREIARAGQHIENRLAIETTLPLLQSLDEAHKRTLPALSLAADLSLKIELQRGWGEPIDRYRFDIADWRQRILDADEKKLVPADKEFAKDEDPTAEKAWAAKQLERLQFDSCLRTFQTIEIKGDTSGTSRTAAIRRIMAKYPQKRGIQDAGKQVIDRVNRVQMRGRAR